jgi:hypothetical protein
MTFRKSRIPTRDQISKEMTSKGGWTKKTLESWGIPWPPIKGWLKDLCKESDRLYGAKNLVPNEKDYFMTLEESRKQRGLPPWIEQ